MCSRFLCVRVVVVGLVGVDLEVGRVVIVVIGERRVGPAGRGRWVVDAVDRPWWVLNVEFIRVTGAGRMGPGLA